MTHPSVVEQCQVEITLLEGNTTIDSRDLLKTFLYDWLQPAKKYASTKKIINNCYCGLVDAFHP